MPILPLQSSGPSCASRRLGRARSGGVASLTFAELATLSESRGAKAGANDSRCQATVSYDQRELSQLDGPSGDVQRCTATLGTRLKSGRSAVRPRP